MKKDLLTEGILNGVDNTTLWERAEDLAHYINYGNDYSTSDPFWKFDCGFKLDFDGPLVNVSSRFYPDYAKDTFRELNWNGSVTLFIDGERFERKFEASNVLELKKSVDAYIGSVNEILKRTADDIRNIL